MSVLQDILSSKERELDELRRTPRSPARTRETIDVCAALRRGSSGPRLIAEIKLRSPSAGRLSRTLAPHERALAYAEAGAAMVSVLCDGPFFDGSWDHLSEARARLEGAGWRVPLLAKEFVLDPRQIQEARDRGADAVLLIVRIVRKATLARLADVARSEGIEPILEVVDEDELDAALAAGAMIIGVNARDLDTLQMDRERTARVVSAIPPGVVAVHFSGVRDPVAVAEVARGRSDAMLVGEALMREDDPRKLLGAMVRAAGNSSVGAATG